MASKTDIVVQLDEMFGVLLEKAKEGNVALEIRIEIFKEGVRWAAVKNKIPDEADKEHPPREGRLGKFKRNLKR